VKALYAFDILRPIWKRGDVGGAAIVWEAAADAEVRDAIAGQPIYQAGMLEIVALVPLEPYPASQRRDFRSRPKTVSRQSFEP
jgi:hypothetical protein